MISKRTLEIAIEAITMHYENVENSALSELRALQKEQEKCLACGEVPGAYSEKLIRCNHCGRGTNLASDIVHIPDAKEKVEVEAIYSVDDEGEWDKGAHILRSGTIINYGNGPEDYIVVGDLPNKMRELKKLQQSRGKVLGERWVIVNDTRGLIGSGTMYQNEMQLNIDSIMRGLDCVKVQIVEVEE